MGNGTHQFLTQVKGNPLWTDFLEYLAKERPTIPEYNGENTEEWIKASFMKQGYDLCLAKMKVKVT